MRARDYRARARQVLSGNWLLSALVVLVAGLLGGSLTSGSSLSIDLSDLGDLNVQLSPAVVAAMAVMLNIGFVFGLVSFLIGGTVKLGYCRYLLDQQDGSPLKIKTLFSQFFQFSKGFCLDLLIGIFTLLWMLLFIIPGIMAAYSYAMAPFIQVEHPQYGARECIKRSKELMRGHRWELFCLELSFFGWALLSIFTLGIGAIFVNAYSSAAKAAFYRNLVGKPTEE